MTITRAWIARHTGLPSFELTAPPGEGYTIEAQDETGRRWDAVIGRGTGKPQYRSDPLALPGVKTTYRSRSRGTERVLYRSASDWWLGMVSRMDGRTIPDLAWVKNGDPRQWKSGVKRFNSRMARWPMEGEPVTGTGILALFRPDRDEDVRSILYSPEPLLVFPGEETPGLPPRVVTVDSVDSARITGDGWLQYTVGWTEVPLDSPMLRRSDGSAGAAVVTWGEWHRLDGGWKRRTYRYLCQQIAGMPS